MHIRNNFNFKTQVKIFGCRVFQYVGFVCASHPFISLHSWNIPFTYQQYQMPLEGCFLPPPLPWPFPSSFPNILSSPPPYRRLWKAFIHAPAMLKAANQSTGHQWLPSPLPVGSPLCLLPFSHHCSSAIRKSHLTQPASETEWDSPGLFFFITVHYFWLTAGGIIVPASSARPYIFPI